MGVLLFQTAHILAGEKRYINLRHLLIKWISLLLALLAGQRVQHYTAHPAAFAAIWHCLALLLVLPSKVTAAPLSSCATSISSTSPSARSGATTKPARTRAATR